MNLNNYVKLPTILRKTDGATTALVICCSMTILTLGMACLYIIESIVGDQQVIKATDFGTLASAQSIPAIGLTPAQVADVDANNNPDIIPKQFISCAVDSHGNPAMGVNSNNQPLDAKGNVISDPFYTVNSYDRACARTIQAFLYAAKNPSSAGATSDAIALYNCLEKFKVTLSTDILNAAGGNSSSSNPVINAFNALAGSNFANILPGFLFGSSAPNLVPGSMRLACDPASKVSNVYLPQVFVNQIASLPNGSQWLNLIQSNVPANVSVPAGTSAPVFLKAGTALDMSQINSNFITTDSSGNSHACIIALNPADGPTHLISNEIFNASSNITNPTAASAPASNLPLKMTYPPLGETWSGGTASLAVTENGKYYMYAPNYTSILSANGFNPSEATFSVGSSNTQFTYAGSGSGQWAGWVQVNLAPGQSSPINTPNPPDPLFVFNAVQALGQSGRGTVQSNGPNDSTAPIRGGSGGGGSFNLTVLSAALAGSGQQYEATISDGYMRLVNGIDFVSIANGTGNTTNSLQSSGYNNVELEPSARACLGFNGNIAPITLNSLIQQLPQPSQQYNFIKDVFASILPQGILQQIQRQGIQKNSQTYNYLQPFFKNFVIPTATGGNKTSFTAVEYAKAQVIDLFAAGGLKYTQSNYPNVLGLPALPGEQSGHRSVLPITPGTVWLPMAAVTSSTPNPLNTGLCSGMKDLIGPPSGGFSSSPGANPYSGTTDSTIQGNNQNILNHIAWADSTSVNNFERVPASPMQLIYDLNVLNNNGTFNSTDSAYSAILNAMLTQVQTMNPDAGYTMQDLVNALSSRPVDSSTQAFDLGAILYLSDHLGVLQLSVNPPPGDSGGGADGTTPLQYYTTYVVAGGTSGGQFKTLVDTAAGTGAATGDCSLPGAPYACCTANGDTSAYIYAEDMMQWTPSTGAVTGSVNLGDLRFFESVGPSMQFQPPTTTTTATTPPPTTPPPTVGPLDFIHAIHALLTFDATGNMYVPAIGKGNPPGPTASKLNTITFTASQAFQISGVAGKYNVQAGATVIILTGDDDAAAIKKHVPWSPGTWSDVKTTFTGQK